MKTCTTTLLLLCAAAACLRAQFVVNEVHAAPSAGEPEWIELYNVYNQTRVLRNALISDRSATRPLPDIRIPAHGYALLTRDTLALMESRSIPAGTVLVEIKLPSLNNTTDVVVLRNADSTVIDSVYYNTKWGTRGISLERIDPLAAAVSPDNMAASESPDSATAGAINSVVRLDRDARLLSVAVRDDSIVVRVANNGRLALDGCTASLWLDANADGLLQSKELFARTSGIRLDSGAVHTWTVFTGSVKRGYEQSAAIVDFSADERRYNDTLRRTLFFSYPAGTVAINELMFNPPSDASDYIELWNAGTDTVLLDGWCIHDRPTSTRADTLTIRGAVVLPPGAFLAVACDSSVFTQFPELAGSPFVYCGASPLNLNATGDMAVLRDPNGRAIDSVSYSNSWHLVPVSASGGISLEKLNPGLPSAHSDSWSTSGDSRGGTPAQRNSISIPLPAGGALDATPNPFSRSRNDLCMISWSLPFRQAHISAGVYDTHGLPQRSLLSVAFTSAEGFVVWNGENDEGSLLAPGAYIVVLEAVDIATGGVAAEKLIVVIAP